MPFPIQEMYIVETENELNVMFLALIKGRMMKVNGSEVNISEYEFELYPFLDNSTRKRISRTNKHIGVETKKAREWRSFLKNRIAVGGDGFGNQLILIHDGDGS